MSSPPFYLIALGLLAAYWFTRSQLFRRRSDVRALPGPPSAYTSWIWGHEKLSFDGGITVTYTNWTALFGPVYKMKAALFHPDIVVITDHTAVHHIFQNYDDFVKAPQIRRLMEKLVGKGILAHEHNSYRRQRRLLAPAFSAEAVKGMMDHIEEIVQRFENALISQLLSEGGGVTVNIVEWMSKCTMDIIGRTSFGHDFRGGESAEAQKIRKAWDVQLEAANTWPFLAAQFVLRSFPLLASLPLPLMSETRMLREVVSDIAMELLQRGEFDEKGRDALSILVRASNQDGAKDRLSSQELIANICTVMVAGQETSAGSLSFTFLELARHPECQHKLREEIRSSGGSLNYDDIQKLPYLDAVVKEILRLHPVVPWTERMASRDTVIPLKKPLRTIDGKTLSSVSVSAGQVIHVPFLTMHLNPDVWGPNANEFVPERWITPGGVPPAAELPHGWSGLGTFSDGPRLCLGYRLAVLEMKAIVATFVRTFEFHDTGAVVTEQPKPTLQAVTDGRIAFLPLRLTLAV